MNLIDKVKPEVLKTLEKEIRIEYSYSYKCIIASLNAKRDYRDLTINEVTNLVSFLSPKFQPEDSMDWQWGDYLLQKKYQI